MPLLVADQQQTLSELIVGQRPTMANSDQQWLRTRRLSVSQSGFFKTGVTFMFQARYMLKNTFMKKILISCVAVLMAISASIAQKVVYDDNNARKRDISSFHAIETSSGIEVIISKGDKEELAVSVGNTEYLNEVSTVVEKGTLKISRQGDWKFWNKWKNWRVKVYVSYKTLDAVKATSGGSVNGTDISLEKLTARLNSGGTINLSGTVASLDVDGSSGAQFRGYGLSAVNCIAEASSGAGIQITVTKEISAKANSGGFIRFKGEALIRDINVNSGGSVKRQS